MSSKRHQDPQWAESQVLSLNYDCALAEFVGGQGLSDRELAELTPEPTALERELTAGRVSWTCLTRARSPGRSTGWPNRCWSGVGIS